MTIFKTMMVGGVALTLGGCAGVEIPDWRGGFSKHETTTSPEDAVTQQVEGVSTAIPQTDAITTTTLGDPLVQNNVDRGPCVIGGDNSGRPHCPQS